MTSNMVSGIESSVLVEFDICVLWRRLRNILSPMSPVLFTLLYVVDNTIVVKRTTKQVIIRGCIWGLVSSTMRGQNWRHTHYGSE